MSLNESIIEDAALECFGKLGYSVGHGPHLAPGEPAAERDSFSEVMQFRFAQTLTRPLPWGEEREAIRRVTPAIPCRTIATLSDPAVAGLSKLLSVELSIPDPPNLAL